MESEYSNVIEDLNNSDRSIRIDTSKNVGELINAGRLKTTFTDEVNNHIHTKYSFSPYYPAMAVYKAWNSGLKSAGIVDHDSVGGNMEMIETCKNIGIASTIGMEIRVNFSNTALEGKRINNPSSANNAYMVYHGIPVQELSNVNEFLKPIHESRNKRNQKILDNINSVLIQQNIEKLDYQNDILKISEADEGGAVTERHLLFALSERLISSIGKWEKLISFIKENLKIHIEPKLEVFLLDENNPYYLFDLMGVFKQSFLEDVFIQPDDEECVSVYDAVKLGNKINAITLYSYLGDVTESITGDIKAEKFEDDYLDFLFLEIKRIGFQGVTYMPNRNSLEQLLYVQKLAKEFDMMEICGIDINSPRQLFNCPILMKDNFKHLIRNAWALIAHEKLAGYDLKYSFYNPDNPLNSLSLQERIKKYSEIGKQIKNDRPEEAYTLIDF